MPVPLRDSFRPPHVLVVEADADNREFYRDSLTIAGWDVTQAKDGREALVKLMTLPSLLLTELRLPIIDGITLCEIVRRDRRMSALPILIVTSEARATQIARASRAGADAVLLKPSTSDDLLDEMNRLLAATTISAPRRREVPVKADEPLVATTSDVQALDLMCRSASHRCFISEPIFPE
jgi:CheY-like chemotaxis protein